MINTINIIIYGTKLCKKYINSSCKKTLRRELKCFSVRDEAITIKELLK